MAFMLYYGGITQTLIVILAYITRDLATLLHKIISTYTILEDKVHWELSGPYSIKKLV